eukprot:1320591-Prymnesium_polylepis.1
MRGLIGSRRVPKGGLWLALSQSFEIFFAKFGRAPARVRRPGAQQKLSRNLSLHFRPPGARARLSSEAKHVPSQSRALTRCVCA